MRVPCNSLTAVSIPPAILHPFRRAGLTLLAILLTCTSPSADPIPWQLRPTCQVDGAGVFLSSVVDSIPAGLAPVRLANPPATGQVLTFTRAQISDLLRRSHPTLAATNWGGAPQIRVSRRTRTLADAELRDLLTATLQRDYVRDRGELELRLSSPWNPIPVPEEVLFVRILDLPASGVTPNFIARFELRTAHDSVGQWQVPVQARLWRDVWVAGARILRGQPIKDADLLQERRDLLSLRDPVLRLNTDDTSLEFAENLTPGIALTSRSLRPRSVVLRGQVLDAVIQDGPLSITVKVEALENGAPGQNVRVRNLKSKREFRGKVQNEESVLVAL